MARFAKRVGGGPESRIRFQVPESASPESGSRTQVPESGDPLGAVLRITVPRVRTYAFFCPYSFELGWVL